MTKLMRPSLFAAILTGIVCGIGCSPMTFMSFLSPEPTIPPAMHPLAIKDKKGPVSVVILTDASTETREEIIGADRQLSDLVKKMIAGLATANNEELSFVNLRKVEEYKSTHPHWQEDVAEVGRDLKADFVIYLEINSMSLFEKGSNRSICLGEADLAVSLYKVADVDGTPDQKHFHDKYPKSTGGIPVDQELSPTDFREKFLTYLAKRIAWNFEGHPQTDKYMEDAD